MTQMINSFQVPILLNFSVFLNPNAKNWENEIIKRP